MERIKEHIASLKLAKRQSHLNLCVFPLLAANEGEADHITLEEALEQGLAEVTEISRGGSVPELRLVNHGKMPVLVIEGEELIGAKQNRAVNASFLVAGLSEVVVPVSCVEQGRWAYASDKFAPGKNIVPVSCRRRGVEEVSESLERGQGFRTDQGRLWSDVAEQAARMGVDSPTGAMRDIFEKQSSRLDDYLDAFTLVEGQTGAVFGLDGQVAGVECLGHAGSFARFFPKLVRSYALDAVDRPQPRKAEAPPESAKRFLKAVSEAKGAAHATPGLGESLRLSSSTLSGSALVLGPRVLHLSAFRKTARGGQGRVGYARFSRRPGHGVIVY